MEIERWGKIYIDDINNEMGRNIDSFVDVLSLLQGCVFSCYVSWPGGKLQANPTRIDILFLSVESMLFFLRYLEMLVQSWAAEKGAATATTLWCSRVMMKTSIQEEQQRYLDGYKSSLEHLFLFSH